MGIIRKMYGYIMVEALAISRILQQVIGLCIIYIYLLSTYLHVHNQKARVHCFEIRSAGNTPILLQNRCCV